MAARAAVTGLRSDPRRCAKRNRYNFTYQVKDIHIGDEAFMVDVFTGASCIVPQNDSICSMSVARRTPEHGGEKGTVFVGRPEAAGVGLVLAVRMLVDMKSS